MLSICCMLLASLSYAQIGIKTSSPNAALHIEPSSVSAPTGEDGILVPRIQNFPAVNPVRAGQIVFLKDNTVLADGFYYWTGTAWLSFPALMEREIDPTLYAFDGVGYSGTSLSREINFTKFKKKTTDGFSVSNNEITVGKSGLYLMSLTTNTKRAGAPEQQANFTYSVLLNGTGVASVVSSVAAEPVSSTSAKFSFLQRLAAGDKLKASVEKSNEGSTTFNSFGINSLTLYFINE